MAVMMNTLGRRAQAQSDAPQAGQEGEPAAKEKVLYGTSMNKAFFLINLWEKYTKRSFFTSLIIHLILELSISTIYFITE